MAKPPSYFLFHPDRVGIIIFACDFFKLKPPPVPQRGISVGLQHAARTASAVALKNRTNFQKLLCIFYTIIYCMLDPMGNMFLGKILFDQQCQVVLRF